MLLRSYSPLPLVCLDPAVMVAVVAIPDSAIIIDKLITSWLQLDLSGSAAVAIHFDVYCIYIYSSTKLILPSDQTPCPSRSSIEYSSVEDHSRQ